MKRGLVATMALCALGVVPGAATGPAAAQGVMPGAPQCSQFVSMSAETKKKAEAVQAAINAKADRKQVCVLMTSFVAAEAAIIKFLEENKTWCGVPDQAITTSKANHEKSMKFRTAACEEGPRPKAPSLSDAIKAPTVDSANNTKTGRGTFDTLTGNPLAR